MDFKSYIAEKIALATEGEKENIYKNLWVKWKLNTYYKETFSIVKPLTQAGFTVELFYKEAN